jgi:uracil-DNA glycosylase
VIELLPADWSDAIGSRIDAADLAAIDSFVAKERQEHEIYPCDELVFAAFELTPFESVRAVILGQDPYHEPGQAHGLAFSTLGDPRPPSLRNILQELHADCGYEMPDGGSLEPWARNGVLLLNAALTVRQGKANSHAKCWRVFTGAVVEAVAAKAGPIAFLLWGEDAKRQRDLIDPERHVVIECSHPSPYSARLDFFGRRPFSEANAGLRRKHAPEIVWRLGLPQGSASGALALAAPRARTQAEVVRPAS